MPVWRLQHLTIYPTPAPLPEMPVSTSCIQDVVDEYRLQQLQYDECRLEQLRYI